jgi:hypothetical protein
MVVTSLLFVWLDAAVGAREKFPSSACLELTTLRTELKSARPIIIHAEGVLVQEKWAGIIIHAGGVRGDFPSSAPKARVCEQ